MTDKHMKKRVAEGMPWSMNTATSRSDSPISKCPPIKSPLLEVLATVMFEIRAPRRLLPPMK